MISDKRPVEGLAGAALCIVEQGTIAGPGHRRASANAYRRPDFGVRQRAPEGVDVVAILLPMQLNRVQVELPRRIGHLLQRRIAEDANRQNARLANGSGQRGCILCRHVAGTASDENETCE